MSRHLKAVDLIAKLAHKDVPVLDGVVRLRALDAKSRAEYVAGIVAAQKSGDDPHAMFRSDIELVARSMIDPDSARPLCTVEEVGQIDASLVQSLAEEARLLSGLGASATESAADDLKVTPNSASVST